MTRRDPFLGLRNEIIHGYASVDPEIVLRTIRENLPPLIRQLEAALRAEGAPT